MENKFTLKLIPFCGEKSQGLIDDVNLSQISNDALNRIRDSFKTIIDTSTPGLEKINISNKVIHMVNNNTISIHNIK